MKKNRLERNARERERGRATLFVSMKLCKWAKVAIHLFRLRMMRIKGISDRTNNVQMSSSLRLTCKIFFNSNVFQHLQEICSNISNWMICNYICIWIYNRYSRSRKAVKKCGSCSFLASCEEKKTQIEMRKMRNFTFDSAMSGSYSFCLRNGRWEKNQQLRIALHTYTHRKTVLPEWKR